MIYTFYIHSMYHIVLHSIAYRHTILPRPRRHRQGQARHEVQLRVGDGREAPGGGREDGEVEPREGHGSWPGQATCAAPRQSIALRMLACGMPKSLTRCLQNPRLVL